MKFYTVGHVRLVDVTELTEFERFMTYRTAHLTVSPTQLDGPPPGDHVYIPMVQRPDYRGRPQWVCYGGRTSCALGDIDMFPSALYE